MHLKICGLTTTETLKAADTAGADMVGLVFYPPSPRNISVQDAVALLADYRPKQAKVVALTVDASPILLDDIINQVKPDMLQLHGHETPEQVTTVKQQYGLPVIKAIGVATFADLEKTKPYLGIADWLLIDAQVAGGLPGGNNATIDWQMLAGWRPGTPWLLAGGLNMHNICTALSISNPDGIDVSSGVESQRGVKDAGMIADFVTHVKHLQKPA